MSSMKDDNLRKRVEIKVAKEAMAFSFMEKNKGLSLLNQHPTESKASFSHTMISGDNVLEKKTRQSQCSSKLIPSEDCSSQDKLSHINSDEDWDVPLRLKRELKKKTETITLNLPSKCIPTILADTCTTKTSSRNKLKIVSTLFKAGGADMNEASLSVSTIRRQREAAVQSHAKELRSTFATFKQFQDTFLFLVLHWDGEIIQLMDGKTEDRLAIAVSSPWNLSGQFIASPAIAEGTGDTMAKCVFKIMNDFELIESATASNTGQWRRSATSTSRAKTLLALACMQTPYTRTFY